MASRGVALLTKASAVKLDGKRLVAKPLEEDVLCLDEWIAARGDDNSRLVSEFVRAFVTRSTIVLQPSQMILQSRRTARRPQRAHRLSLFKASSGAKKLIGFL